jgi:hypothetical protein
MATATVTGRYADIQISGINADVFGLSDFSLTFDRGTIEQELVGRIGNYFEQGAMSIEGSLTNCRFGASGQSPLVDSLIDEGYFLSISGCVNSGNKGGDDNLGFYFKSCQVTGYDVSIGDASTISEASIDFTVLDPYNATYSNGWITGA